jgi:hypothetical protein
VEQDPMAILATVEKCLAATAASLKTKGYTAADVRAIGVTNQRETTIVWDPITGVPLCGQQGLAAGLWGLLVGFGGPQLQRNCLARHTHYGDGREAGAADPDQRQDGAANSLRATHLHLL